MTRLLGLLVLVLAPACRAAEPRPVPPVRPEPVGSVRLPESAPTSWKERLAQPYVFLEARGDYRELGEPTRRLASVLGAAGIEPSGPPFRLYYDDPGTVPVHGLRARVCFPVQSVPAAAPAGLGFDVLPRATVAYTRVSGARSEVPRVYPTLLRWMAELGWRRDGPIREVHLDVVADGGPGELVTEVQVPWTRGG